MSSGIEIAVTHDNNSNPFGCHWKQMQFNILMRDEGEVFVPVIFIVIF